MGVFDLVRNTVRPFLMSINRSRTFTCWLLSLSTHTHISESEVPQSSRLPLSFCLCVCVCVYTVSASLWFSLSLFPYVSISMLGCSIYIFFFSLFFSITFLLSLCKYISQLTWVQCYQVSKGVCGLWSRWSPGGFFFEFQLWFLLCQS